MQLAFVVRISNIHLVRSDMLSNSSELGIDYLRIADRIEQSGFAMVDMTHDCDDRWTRNRPARPFDTDTRRLWCWNCGSSRGYWRSSGMDWGSLNYRDDKAEFLPNKCRNFGAELLIWRRNDAFRHQRT